jgi:hypothetical protein
MHELTLTTPALLFSAVSLILLAYTNRFLGYAQLVRSLYEKFKENPDNVLLAQIKNLRRRVHLTKAMQILGVQSLLFCVGSMFLIYINFNILAIWVFGLALLQLIVSLGISAYEIHISVKALDLHLNELEKYL